MSDEFAFLSGLSAADIAGLLSDETASVAAAALKALPRELNTQVFLKLPAEHRSEVAAAMATAKIPGSLLDIMRGEISAGLQEKAAARGLLKTGKAPAAAEQPLPPRSAMSGTARTDTPVSADAAAAKANPLSAMLSRLSPKLRENLSAVAVIPEAAKTPPSTPPAPAPVIPPRPAAAAPAQENMEKTPADAERRAAAIQQILQRRAGARTTFTGAADAPAANPGMDRFRQQALKNELAEARRLAAQGANEKIDGLTLAASIIREAGAAVRGNIQAAAPQLYAALRQHMFVFADLEKSPDKTLAVVFSGIEPRTAALALRFASDNLRTRVLAAVPPRRSELINDEIAHAAARVRLNDIENAQQAVIDFAVHLQNQGKLIIDARDPDLI